MLCTCCRNRKQQQQQQQPPHQHPSASDLTQPPTAVGSTAALQQMAAIPQQVHHPSRNGHCRNVWRLLHARCCCMFALQENFMCATCLLPLPACVLSGACRYPFTGSCFKHTLATGSS
jgi:hypothetical protein